MPQLSGAVLPIAQPAPALQFVALTEELKKGTAHASLRQEWINMKLKGKREKKAKEAAEAKKSEKPDAAAE